MEGKRPQRAVWIAAGIFCLLAVAAAVAVMVIRAGNRQETEDTYTKIQRQVNEVSAQKTAEKNIPEQETAAQNDFLTQHAVLIPEKNLDWDKLHELNPDIYAWIYVPGTEVDYPVLQHPEDNSYYLNHNIDGSEGYPGCIYSEDYNAKDFSDIHTVLYGHNLKDQTMFTTLHNFEDADLFAGDHYIYIYTEDNVWVYQIFAAYERDQMHLLANYDFSNEYIYEEYLKQIYEAKDRAANVRLDLEVTTADQILTLSTCTKDHNSSLRFLVAGVLRNPVR